MESRENHINQLLSFKNNIKKDHGENAENILLEVDRIIKSIKSVEGNDMDQLLVSCKNLEAAFNMLHLVISKNGVNSH